MSEPPLRVSAEGVELEPKRHGHRWVDFAVSGSAILISLISLVVAIQHGRTQERLVAAYSWPFLQGGTSNLSDGGGSVVAVKLVNGGVGPAIVRDFRMFLDGEVVRNPGELMQRCCGWAPGADLSRPEEAIRGLPAAMLMQVQDLRTGAAVGVLKPGGETALVTLPLTAANGAMWRDLNLARNRLTFKACYCSVLGECWTSDLTAMEPKPVEACPARGPDTFVG